MSGETPSQSWESVPHDPDPVADLGFRGTELDIIRQSDGEHAHLLVLPRDEALLREDAFIIADEEAVVELESQA